MKFQRLIPGSALRALAQNSRKISLAARARTARARMCAREAFARVILGLPITETLWCIFLRK